MSAPITPDQLEHYWREGYLSGIRAFSPEEAASYLERLEAIERAQLDRLGGTWWPRDYRPWEQADHPLADWLHELAHHPGVLDAVAAVLGPNVLIRNADLFVKEPSLRRGIGWHQDTAEKGPDADCLLTAWIGLTESTEANGCLQFSAGSHRLDLPDGPTDKHTLTLKPTAVAALAPQATVSNLMEPGMMSMHHFRTVHRSGPNATDRRRVGFVVRFMSPAISQATAESGQATLVRGTDSHGHFALKPRFPMTWTR
jgi:non-heme Fe2+,alpha-ketoglutarate-dependent halogenase